MWSLYTEVQTDELLLRSGSSSIIQQQDFHPLCRLRCRLRLEVTGLFCVLQFLLVTVSYCYVKFLILGCMFTRLPSALAARSTWFIQHSLVKEFLWLQCWIFLTWRQFHVYETNKWRSGSEHSQTQSDCIYLINDPHSPSSGALQGSRNRLNSSTEHVQHSSEPKSPPNLQPPRTGSWQQLFLWPHLDQALNRGWYNWRSKML